MDIYSFVLIVGALLLGAVVGSFINALSFRFNTGRGISGRSRCMHCGHVLGFLDLVPVFSYLFLRGRCRYCYSRISPQYPLVEVAAAVLALLVYLSHSELLAFSFWFVVWMVLLFIIVYDLRHTIIPWSFSLTLGALALFYLALSFGGVLDFVSPMGLTKSLPWSLLAGPVLALPLLLISLVSRGRLMGWGDGVLELSLGWMLGLSQGLTALMLAFWTGAAVGIVLILSSKRPTSSKTSSRGGYTMKSEVPFAPFLVLGAFLAYFFHVDFFATLPLLF